jgi:hypothetical protein
MKREIICYCEEKFQAEVPDLIDLKSEKEAVDRILSGDFMSVACPKCKKVLKPEFPFRLVDKERKLDLFFIPEMDRVAYFMGKLEYKTGSPARIVIGYPELVEKALCHKYALDDRVIEALKYYLLKKASESLTENQEVSVRFISREADQFTFHIEGIKKDEVGVTGVKTAMYDKVAHDIEKTAAQDPMKAFLTPPYVSVNRIYLEK